MNQMSRILLKLREMKIPHKYRTGWALKKFFHSCLIDGAVAQLGERLDGIQKVVGSIPSSSTKNLSFIFDI